MQRADSTEIVGENIAFFGRYGCVILLRGVLGAQIWAIASQAEKLRKGRTAAAALTWRSQHTGKMRVQEAGLSAGKGKSADLLVSASKSG